MNFLGIDLGWSSGASGLCCLGWRDHALELLDLRCVTAMADILAWVDRWLPADCPGGIAVDAPTLIPNETGMRLPDRLAHKYFGRYHAGCYPANQQRPFAARTVGLGEALTARGFDHAPEMQAQQPTRFQIEVFPHPATVHLFGLSRILKYKKGRLADRRQALAQLRDYQCQRLPQLDPALDLVHSSLTLPDIPERGAAVKAVEDQLDSLTCAYVAAHWWQWGTARNWVLGDRAQGYIIVPAPING